MEAIGFSAKYGNSYENFCRNFSSVSACKPGVIVPRPDPAKRLNSQFCKSFPLSKACGK
jgi:hypothetical protein